MGAHELLSGHFLDVLQGITTLKLFGRAKDQIKVIGRLSEEFKDSTLKVLRVAFLSALVLELVSTISTALIAVYLGLTLLDGEIAFFPAFLFCYWHQSFIHRLDNWVLLSTREWQVKLQF